MTKRLVITGSAGLVGRRLVARCRSEGYEVVEIDLRGPPEHRMDFASPEALALCDGSVHGVIHLAAVSRVAWGEQNPALCRAINVADTARLLKHLHQFAPGAWFLFASSREVYGEPRDGLVHEHHPLAPVNVYGSSKLDGEALVSRARDAGRATATIRLSNVYGGRHDHPDRAVPALACRAVRQQSLQITGGDVYFDFVHVNDAVEGLLRAAELLSAGENNFPTVHLATGRATSLRRLAKLTLDLAGGPSRIEEQAARSFDVSGFCGAPGMAERVLGWKAAIPLETGLKLVLEDFRRNGPLSPFPLASLEPGPRCSKAA